MILSFEKGEFQILLCKRPWLWIREMEIPPRAFRIATDVSDPQGHSNHGVDDLAVSHRSVLPLTLLDGSHREVQSQPLDTMGQSPVPQDTQDGKVHPHVSHPLMTAR